jgi:osmotically-inducible protein OsmY
MTRTIAHTAHRTDADIFAEARYALDQRPGVPGTVRVHVDRGMATLTGTVRLAVQRADAEDAIRHIEGLHGVVNDIVVVHATDEGFGPPVPE